MISVKGISASYGEKMVLKNIDFSVAEGEIVSVIGKSGSGKTTLLKVLNGLLKPVSGQYLFNDKYVYNLPENKIKEICTQKIGFVWQNYRLIPEITVEQNILIPSMINKQKADPEYIHELLDLLEIKEYINTYPGKLSGGEKQRVSLARALALKPKIVIADEPTGALDSLTSENLMSLLLKVNKMYKTSMVIATHNMDLAAIASRKIELVDGELVSNEKH